MKLYKAVRPDGYDFYSGTVLYEVGKVVEHPTSKKYGDMCGGDPSTYLSGSTVPTDCTGMRWPCRLVLLEGIGRACRDERYPNQRGFRAVRVDEELPATDALGPQGVEVAALIERCKTLTSDEAKRLSAAGSATGAPPAGAAAAGAAAATWSATWWAARPAARSAADAATWSVAGSVAGWAAVALVVRDLITPEQFDLLYGPWASVMEGK